uniref:RRM domain-containing protein n=1 Tax=Romanomermis culicivorax TaxID=13658 RepID=A0A915KS76_ROMCU
MCKHGPHDTSPNIKTKTKSFFEILLSAIGRFPSLCTEEMNQNGSSKIEISFGSLTLDDFCGIESSLNKLPPQQMMFDPNVEIFARKVFIGGLPMDISEEQIKSTFNKFGPCIVDWPHKSETKAFYPPKGYAFLIFENETSVQYLANSCLKEDDKYYLGVNSQTCKDKPVQVRPWCLVDSEYYLDRSLSLDLRKTVFIGGVPRPLKARKLHCFTSKTVSLTVGLDYPSAKVTLTESVIGSMFFRRNLWCLINCVK